MTTNDIELNWFCMLAKQSALELSQQMRDSQKENLKKNLELLVAAGQAGLARLERL